MRFDTILVANRGEVAVRILRTARSMGLRTAVVYSDVDARMPHVGEAERAVCIGSALPSESYLNIERILDAARRTCAQAIHPGYGFLSESAEFAQACCDAGFTFIGPSPAAILAMGNKATAKAMLRHHGVPCIPGYNGEIQEDSHLEREARRIGFPLFVKAVAGGGGKGMRLVYEAAQLGEALRGARSEARKAFGDDTLMLEKAVLAPRHIEVQVFGDSHGNLVYLGDRDCSIQRRHQKVIEEAPAPGIETALRARMGETAIRVARAVDYVGAGTVEFLVAPDGEFYFLEMNTRLQVEHPVTEMVTGLDLVEWQIRIARGERIPLRQDEIPCLGHAIEARVYAEDTCHDFLPQTGCISIWEPPEGEGVRVDSGLAMGMTVGTAYDPMVAKVIGYGSDRDTARRRLAAALQRFYIGGLRNNLHFLRQCLLHPAFVDATVDTGFLDRESIDVSACANPDQVSVSIAACLWQSRDLTYLDPSLRNWRSRPWRSQPMTLDSGRRRITVRVRAAPGEPMAVEHDDGSVVLAMHREDGLFNIDGVDESVRFAWSDSGLDLVRGDVFFHFSRASVGDGVREKPGAALVTAPMPGNVAELRVVSGTVVTAGAVLVVLEAMKMEHQIHAPFDGRVAMIYAEAGQQVGMHQALVQIAALESELGELTVGETWEEEKW